MGDDWAMLRDDQGDDDGDDHGDGDGGDDGKETRRRMGLRRRGGGGTSEAGMLGDARHRRHLLPRPPLLGTVRGG
jgi:hypothetical protein